MKNKLPETINATRFGEISTEDAIHFKEGIYGFEGYTNWKLMDIDDGTMISWLQSLDNPEVAMPMIEAPILDKDGEAGHFYILMIPRDIRDMSANKKAPIVIEGKKGKQIMKDSGDVKHMVYSELKKICINS